MEVFGSRRRCVRSAFRGPMEVIAGAMRPPGSRRRPRLHAHRLRRTPGGPKRWPHRPREMAPRAGRARSCGSSAAVRSARSASLRALAQRLGCGDRVRFPGFGAGSERDAMLSSLDCLVMASAREGWGRVVPEAARNGGVPSAGYDARGLRDAISTAKLVCWSPNSVGSARRRDRTVDPRPVASQPSRRAAAAENLRGFTAGFF